MKQEKKDFMGATELYQSINLIWQNAVMYWEINVSLISDLNKLWKEILNSGVSRQLQLQSDAKLLLASRLCLESGSGGSGGPQSGDHSIEKRMKNKNKKLRPIDAVQSLHGGELWMSLLLSEVFGVREVTLALEQYLHSLLSFHTSQSQYHSSEVTVGDNIRTVPHIISSSFSSPLDEVIAANLILHFQEISLSPPSPVRHPSFISPSKQTLKKNSSNLFLNPPSMSNVKLSDAQIKSPTSDESSTDSSTFMVKNSPRIDDNTSFLKVEDLIGLNFRSSIEDNRSDNSKDRRKYDNRDIPSQITEKDYRNTRLSNNVDKAMNGMLIDFHLLGI